MSEIESYASVWDAIADAPEQAANLRARAELMQKIAAIIKQDGWTRVEAARRRGAGGHPISRRTSPRGSRGCGWH
jgi:predicted XRE-type DNA-binding protein